MLKKLGRYFWICFAGYLTLSITVLAMVGIPTYTSLYRNSEQRYEAMAQDSMNSLSGLFSDLFEEMDQQGYALRINNPVRLQSESYELLQLYQKLGDMLTVANDAYQEVALLFSPSFFVNEPYVYSSSGVWQAPLYFLYSHHYDNWSRDEIYANIPQTTASCLRMPEKMTVNQSIAKTVATYVVPFDRNGRNTRGVALFMMNQSALQKLVRLSNLPQGSSVLMYDQNGALNWAFDQDGLTLPLDELGALHRQTEGNGRRDYRLYEATSAYNGYRYVLLLPQSYFTQGINRATRSAILYLAVTLLAAAALSIMMTIRSSRPVRRLHEVARRYGQADEGTNELKSIEQTISKLGEDNLQMSESLRTQRGAVRNDDLQRLFNGHYERLEQTERMLREDGILPGGCPLRVMVVRIDGNESFYGRYDRPMRSLIRYALSKMTVSVLEASSLNGACCDFGQGDHVAVLLSNEEMGDLMIERVAQRLSGLVLKNFHFTLTVGVSGVFKALDQAALAYERALRATDGRYLCGYDCVLYENTREETDDAPEALGRLLEVFRRGKAADCREALDRLVEQLIASGQPRQAQAIMQDVIVCCCRWVSERLPMQGSDHRSMMDEAQATRYETIDQAHTAALRIISLVEQEIESRHNAQKTGYVQKAMTYAQENLADTALNIDRAALEVGLSPSHLSRLFRECGDVSFAQYVDQQRMQRACDLLKNTRLRIAQILEQCGYVDKANFLRKFKKMLGITPTEYRQRESVFGEEDWDE